MASCGVLKVALALASSITVYSFFLKFNFNFNYLPFTANFQSKFSGQELNQTQSAHFTDALKAFRTAPEIHGEDLVAEGRHQGLHTFKGLFFSPRRTPT